LFALHQLIKYKIKKLARKPEEMETDLPPVEEAGRQVVKLVHHLGLPNVTTLFHLGPLKLKTSQA
jgi:hypothetical protein